MKTIGILLVAALAGCVSMAPKYERPASPVRKQLPGGEGTVKVPEIGAFVSEPKLRALIARALGANRDLRRAVIDIEAARAQYRVQRAAGFPTLDLQASITSIRSVFPGLVEGSTISATSASVLGVFAWEIDVFGRIKSLTNAAEMRVLATAELARAARVSLVGELATAYITLAADRSRLVIAQETMANGKRVMDLTEQLVGGGTSNRSDFYQASTVFHQARADVALLSAAIEQDKNALELLVGGPVAEGELPTEMPEDATWFTEVPVGLSSEVLLERPDVKAAEYQLMAANANIGAARAQFFPNLSLTGNAGLASTTLAALFSGPAFVFQVVPALGLPLFRGGANRANLALSEAQKAALVATYEGTIQRAFRDVADTLATKATIVEQLDAQKALVESAEKTVEISQARYQAGIDPFLTTLVSQRALYGAQLSLVATRVAAMNNRVALYRSLGGGAR